jgi:glycosyltransferase involved in cell wall biosynthesis
MRILIATTQVPFVSGGAEAHAEGLRDALLAAGHRAEIVAIPFKWYPPEKILDHMLASRLIDLTEVSGRPVDLLIGLKFPAYLIPHPNKVLWVLHQYRAAYELWDHPLGDLNLWPNGTEVRDAIRQADKQTIPQARAVFANSQTVAARLKKFCGIEATPLYHPPPRAESFFCAPAEDYLFFPSRVSRLKRQLLVVEALSETRHPVRLKFSGETEDPRYAEELVELARKLKVEPRIEWLGNVTEEGKLFLYAHALGVVYPPVDEDYGYVTLEAMLASKPLITCKDSGGPLEFVRDGETGLVTEPTPQALASAMDSLWTNRVQATAWGEAGRVLYKQQRITWPEVVRRLLS